MLRAIGYVLLVLGIGVALNALIAGPHAFGGGLWAVIGMVIAGTLWAACGVWLLVRKRKTG